MAPKIRVPADFGREHINSEVHGNLILNLKDGRKIGTNSMIMSMNSPVIDNLTTNLFQVISMFIHRYHKGIFVLKHAYLIKTISL